jgi:hypothetical protein
VQLKYAEYLRHSWHAYSVDFIESSLRSLSECFDSGHRTGVADDADTKSGVCANPYGTVATATLRGHAVDRRGRERELPGHARAERADAVAAGRHRL